MIRIKESKSADTRSAEGNITEQALYDASIQHIEDVTKALHWMQDELQKRLEAHDHTKLSHIEEFYGDFVRARKDKSFDFCKANWYQRHITEERHHLDARVPEDVNMFDLMERIADCVMAGMARTGKVFPDKISDEVIVKAYHNTIELLKNNVKVDKE